MKMNERSLSRLPLATIALSTLAFAVAGCSDGGTYTKAQGGSSDFASVVFMGDSLTAGYQSGSLVDTSQPHGYAPLIAQQANFRIAQPLIAPPGAPAQLELKSISPLDIVQESGTTTGRDDTTVTPTDVAVPGALVYDVLNTPALSDPTTGQEEITQLVLGFPSLLSGHTDTQYTLALKSDPTTIFLWIGNNDALNAVFAASTAGFTDIATFTQEYTETVGALATSSKAHLVIGNIPDVTLVPYVTPYAELIGELEESGVPAAEAPYVLGAIGINPGDGVLLPALPALEADLATLVAGGAPTPLPAGSVLSAATAAAIQTQVLAYNQVIAGVAAQAGATLVDIHGLFDTVAASGVTANGYPATFQFLNGIFSLDGIHPTNTGYGVLANAFIDAVNADLGSKIKDVDLDTIAKVDPLFPTNFGSATATAADRKELRHKLFATKLTPESVKAITKQVQRTLSRRPLAGVQN